jgi:hypothetical protein
MNEQERDHHRELLLLRSEKAAALRELEAFRPADKPEDLVATAARARLMYQGLRESNDDHALTLMAIAEKLVSFPSAEGTLVGTVRHLVESWRALDLESVRLRARVQELGG